MISNTVIMAYGRGFGHRDYDGSFQAGGDLLLAAVVKDVSEYCSKLMSRDFSTLPGTLSGLGAFLVLMPQRTRSTHCCWMVGGWSCSDDVSCVSSACLLSSSKWEKKVLSWSLDLSAEYLA